MEDKFKQISEAYAVLSDSEKKNQYDTYGSADFQQRFSQEDIFRNFDLGDILKDFGFGGSRGGGFSSAFGGGRQRGGGFRQQQQPMKGKDLEYELPLTIHEIINGTKKTITINQGGIAKAIEVKIPRGLAKGKKIRLAGKGEMSPNGGPAGNLYIKSNPVASDGCTIDGNDILLSKQVLLTQALLGGKIEIVTPDETTINLKIPAGTNHKAKMRIPKHGIPQMKGNGCGDLFVVINIAMPNTLTPEQKELIQQLEKTGL